MPPGAGQAAGLPGCCTFESCGQAPRPPTCASVAAGLVFFRLRLLSPQSRLGKHPTTNAILEGDDYSREVGACPAQTHAAVHHMQA